MRNIQDKKDGEPLTPLELNSLIEELQNIVAKAGLTFNPNSTTQLLEAIKILAGGNSVWFKDTSSEVGQLNLTSPAFKATELTSNMVFRFKTRNLITQDNNKVTINNTIKDVPIVFTKEDASSRWYFDNTLKQELYCEGIIRLKDKDFKDSPPNLWISIVSSFFMRSSIAILSDGKTSTTAELNPPYGIQDYYMDQSTFVLFKPKTNLNNISNIIVKSSGYERFKVILQGGITSFSANKLYVLPWRGWLGYSLNYTTQITDEIVI